jgi:hypothetical protein
MQGKAAITQVANQMTVERIFSPVSVTHAGATVAFFKTRAFVSKYFFTERILITYKNCPKRSQTHCLSKLMHDLNRGEEQPNNLSHLNNFQRNFPK